MSQTYIATYVQFAALILPMLGIQVGSDQLTGAIQTIVVIGTGVWVLYRRYIKGDINVVGAKK